MTKKIKSLLQQAELFRTQGLLYDAQKKLKLVQELIQNSDALPNKQKLLDGIAKKLAILDKDVQSIENASATPEMSTHVNELIKKLFSFSEKDKDEHDAALEGAIALAKFGQFDGAIAEFEKLLTIDTQRITAAKNILRCYIELGSMGRADQLIEEWGNSDAFPSEHHDKVKSFYSEILNKKGIKKEPAPAEEPVSEIATPEIEDDEDEFLDISAVAITFDSGPHQGEQIELDVSFQSGNIISIIISSRDETLIESLKVGYRLEDVHFYSPVAIFRGSGVVSAMTQIKSGPKKGDYSLDIKIESI